MSIISVNDHIWLNIDDAQKSHSPKTCAIFTNDERKPDQIGSGVFFKTDNKFFIITASHVLDDLSDDKTFCVGISNKIVPLQGKFIRTNIITSNDLYDFAIKELSTEDIILLDGAKFVTLDQCAKGVITKKGAIYCAHGYPSSKNKINWEIKNQFDGYAYTYSAKLSENFNYKKLGITTETHLSINFDSKSVVNEEGHKHIPPNPKGMSGGGLWVYPNPLDIFKEVFAGILIEHREDEKSILSVRINCILLLIKQLYPNEIPDVYTKNSSISIQIIKD